MISGLVYIEIFTLSDFRESLYSYCITIYDFFHILLALTLDFAKSMEKIDMAKYWVLYFDIIEHKSRRHLHVCLDFWID